MNTHPSIIAAATLSIALCTSFSVQVAADDWPSWRGPNATGISAETNWTSEGKQANLWEANVGLGYSSLCVADGKLYTFGFHEDKGIDRVVCLDAMTGEEVWSHEYPAKKWDKYHGGGSNSTPVLDEDKLYIVNRDGEFRCYDAASGEVIWEKNLMEEFSPELPTWGFAGSPFIMGDEVLVNIGRIVSFNKASGEENWKSKDYGHAYATPTIVERNGEEVIAAYCGDGLAILSSEDGSELCMFDWKTQYDVNAATPIAVADNQVFISSGYNHGCALVDISGSVGESIWESKVMRNQMATCVLIDGHLYGFDENELKCIDLEGNEVWKQRGLGKGALIAAGERLILLSAKGELIIAKATPDEYTELSRNKVLDGGVDWTMPVIVDGIIYCRNSEGQLVARDHRAE